ncbi:MAG: hypothetical protein ACXVA3_08390 [Vulcanimicrobiaceae bacterium]
MDVHEFASDPLVPRYDNWGPNTPDETHEFLSRKNGRAAELAAQRRHVGR